MKDLSNHFREIKMMRGELIFKRIMEFHIKFAKINRWKPVNGFKIRKSVL